LSTLVLHLFTETKSADDDDDLFSYLKLQCRTSESPVAVQVDNYLNSAPTSVESLASYPHAFIKANSTLPSSAAVERLFSAGR